MQKSNIKNLLLNKKGIALITASAMFALSGCGNSKEEPLQYEPLTTYFEVTEVETTNICYTVQAGDTLTKIISSYIKDEDKVKKYVELTAAINELENPNLIFVGQKLWLPDVPVDLLENYGVSSYSSTYQIYCRLSYINYVLQEVYNDKITKDSEIIKKTDSLYLVYVDFMNETDSETKEVLYSYLITEYDKVIEKIEDYVCVDYTSYIRLEKKKSTKID